MTPSSSASVHYRRGWSFSVQILQANNDVFMKRIVRTKVKQRFALMSSSKFCHDTHDCYLLH